MGSKKLVKKNAKTIKVDVVANTPLRIQHNMNARRPGVTIWDADGHSTHAYAITEADGTNAKVTDLYNSIYIESTDSINDVIVELHF